MLTTTAAEAPHQPPQGSHKIVILPPRRWPVPNIQHLWEGREVLLRFGGRDVTLRYRQTVLGVAWVVLQPLLAAGIFSVVFGKVAKLSSGNVPYFIFSYVGLLGWNLFNTIVSRSTQSLVANSSLVSKVFFPRMLVPFSTVCSALVDFSVAFCLLIVLWFSFGVTPGWPLILAPVWLLMLTLIALGGGCVASALMVRYRDIQYVVPFIMSLLLYASPVAYSLADIPKSYRIFFEINPISWLTTDFRWSLLDQPAPSITLLLLSVTIPCAIFLVGIMLFEKMERGFADVI